MVILSDSDKERIVSLYEGRLSNQPEDHTTVGWGSHADQWMRFEQLFRGYSPRAKRIMDVGCGVGHLVAYLIEQIGDDFEYVGVDITPGLVQRAQETWNGTPHQFITQDILSCQSEETFDLVVLSGALNFRIDDNVAHAQAMLRRMYEMTSEAVCANFLSSYADYELEKNFHYQPETLFGFAKTLTSKVALHHDYPLYEFTLQLRR